jgi:hypothetical protein
MLPAFAFQGVSRTTSRRCAVQEKEHRDGLCASIPPSVPVTYFIEENRSTIG